jgi:hypothetical protein
MPWSYDGLVAPVPAVVRESAPPKLYAVADRHGVRVWTGANPVRLNAWVKFLDGLTIDQARTAAKAFEAK